MPLLKPVGAAGTRFEESVGRRGRGRKETTEKVCEVIRRQQTAFSAALLTPHAASPV